MSRQEFEALFLAKLPVIEKILAALGRRNALAPDAAEEFAGWAKLRLIENEYEILAKFRGESSLATYLTVVLAMLFREYRVHEWGRWRPSAAAKRNGSFGIRLETLVGRDGLALATAGQLLRTSGETTLSDGELAKIVSTFPTRTSRRPVPAGEALATVEGSDRADTEITVAEMAAESTAAKKALEQALQALPADDRVIVRLHYLESMSVADIARALDLPQKPLYRRLRAALASLRAALEQAGVSRDHVRELAADPP